MNGLKDQIVSAFWGSRLPRNARDYVTVDANMAHAIADAFVRSEFFTEAVQAEATRYHHDECTFMKATFSHENIAAVVERTGLSLQTVNEVARELRRG
ncbi:helix-turn-helix DNA binding protein [Arthrobacter phage Beagle]|nr:helix-turn-helix DNA binding protein [Arthrobacter phage Beagle]